MRDDFERLRHFRRDERVVARERQRAGHVRERPVAGVLDERAFPVDGFGRGADRSAVEAANRLMAEADADDRKFAVAKRDQPQQAAGFVGRSRAGRNDQNRVLRPRHFREDFLRGNAVAVDLHVVPAAAEFVDEVVDERVEIIEDEESALVHAVPCRFSFLFDKNHHAGIFPCACAIAESAAAALLRDSSASFCGTESATTPPPA